MRYQGSHPKVLESSKRSRTAGRGTGFSEVPALSDFVQSGAALCPRLSLHCGKEGQSQLVGGCSEVRSEVLSRASASPSQEGGWS